jgi:electron transfer flavoprotein beta subunit
VASLATLHAKMMKILVPTKRVPDPDQKLRLRQDRLGVETENLPFVINPFDAVALEEALQIREGNAGPIEVVAVGIGGEEYEQELRLALAMGADRAILVRCEDGLDPWNVARILTACVEREAPDIVLMGKQSIDNDGNQTGQMLAALLDWPQATFASRIELDGGAARIARETDAGIETVRLQLPAVITADLRLNEPRYAALPAIIRARKKPIESVQLDELRIAIEPRIRIVSMQTTTTSRACVRVKDVDELAQRLQQAAGIT